MLSTAPLLPSKAKLLNPMRMELPSALNVKYEGSLFDVGIIAKCLEHPKGEGRYKKLTRQA